MTQELSARSHIRKLCSAALRAGGSLRAVGCTRVECHVIVPVLPGKESSPGSSAGRDMLSKLKKQVIFLQGFKGYSGHEL
jgi:hypothetical protein